MSHFFLTNVFLLFPSKPPLPSPPHPHPPPLHPPPYLPFHSLLLLIYFSSSLHDIYLTSFPSSLLQGTTAHFSTPWRTAPVRTRPRPLSRSSLSWAKPRTLLTMRTTRRPPVSIGGGGGGGIWGERGRREQGLVVIVSAAGETMVIVVVRIVVVVVVVVIVIVVVFHI